MGIHRNSVSLYGVVLKMYSVFGSFGHVPLEGHKTQWGPTRGPWSGLTSPFDSTWSATMQHQWYLGNTFTMTLSEVWFYCQWLAWQSQIKGITTGTCTAGLSFPCKSWELLEPAEGALASGDNKQPWKLILELPFWTISTNFVRPHSLSPTSTIHKTNKQTNKTI